ncbi:unnamed protein product [Protopolystoma xenopodis]|uniref:Uncharacterized protein n=1 Tax=Protopolystoma xenopodis TaxID=117903 RepID=A0A448WL89_9PLAT|nr:unnamed protein product [Protopolystoma xenopodis]
MRRINSHYSSDQFEYGNLLSEFTLFSLLPCLSDIYEFGPSSSTSTATTTTRNRNVLWSAATQKTVVVPNVSLSGITSNIGSIQNNSGTSNGPTVIRKSTIISAPPQMANPRELAERAREAAEQRDRESYDDPEFIIEVDDDVTRALLAAEAGVTYTSVKSKDGKGNFHWYTSINATYLRIINVLLLLFT